MAAKSEIVETVPIVYCSHPIESIYRINFGKLTLYTIPGPLFGAATAGQAATFL